MPRRDSPEDIADLRDWDDFESKRTDIYDDVKDEVIKGFPISYGGVRLDLHDVDYADPEYFDMAEQKKALLEDRDLARRLRGTLHLTDEATGEVLDKKPLTLMKVPFLTDRGTFIRGGSEYSSIAQYRLLPGSYARRQENGHLENFFNTKSGTGPGFRVGFEPDTAQYRLKVRGANLHLYSLLKDLGETDETLGKSWGPEILKNNQDKYDSRVFDKAYGYFVPKYEQEPDSPRERKVVQIRGAMDKALVHGRVLRRTLPNLYDRNKAAEWRKAAADLDALPFDPEFNPDETFLERAQDPMSKEAAMMTDGTTFGTDLQPEELTDEFQNIYLRRGPRMAGMKEWPAHWFAPGNSDSGWLDWYTQYANGRRTGDDTRQINRWKRFKKLHAPAFRRSPSARRAISLRQWAIDPFKLIPESKHENLRQAIDDYKSQRLEQHLESQEKEASGAYDLVKEAASKGCLMAYLGEPEAHALIEWRQTNIPDSDVVEPENTPHVTVAYGFGEDVTAEKIFKVIEEAGIGPIKTTFGEIKRFPANEHRPESDCLWINVKGKDDLETLRKLVLDKFDCPQTYPDYKPHCCIGYVKPGTLKELDGHCQFDGDKHRIVTLVYSEAESKKKTELDLSKDE